MAAVRYFVKDVDEAVGFYAKFLGFEPSQQFRPASHSIRRPDALVGNHSRFW